MKCLTFPIYSRISWARTVIYLVFLGNNCDISSLVSYGKPLYFMRCSIFLSDIDFTEETFYDLYMELC